MFTYKLRPRFFMDGDGGAGGGTGGTGGAAPPTGGQPGVGGGTPPASGPPAGGTGGTGTTDELTGVPDELKPVVSGLISKRVNELNTKHNTEKEELTKQARAFNKLAKLVGITDPIQLEAKLSEFEENQRRMSIQQAAHQMGMPVQVVETLLKTQADNQATQNQIFELSFNTQLNAVKTNPVYADIDKDPETLAKVKELVKRGMPIENAYWSLQGPAKFAQIQREAEQRVLSEKMGGGAFQPVGAGEGEGGPKLELTADELAYCKQRGMNPWEYQSMKGADNLESFQKIRSQQKKK